MINNDITDERVIRSSMEAKIAKDQADIEVLINDVWSDEDGYEHEPMLLTEMRRLAFIVRTCPFNDVTIRGYSEKDQQLYLHISETYLKRLFQKVLQNTSEDDLKFRA